MVVLKKFVFNTYLETIDEREQKTEQTRSQAQQLSSDAEALLSQYEDAIGRARAEALQSRQSLRAEGIQSREKALAAARTHAQAKLEDAQAHCKQTSMAHVPRSMRRSMSYLVWLSQKLSDAMVNGGGR